MEIASEYTDSTRDEREEDKEIEQLGPSKLRNEDRDEERRTHLTYRTDAIDKPGCAPVQLHGDSIEDNHEAFVRDRTIVRSPDVDALLGT